MVSSPIFISTTRAWCGIGRFEMSGEETSLTERLLRPRPLDRAQRSGGNQPPFMDLHPKRRRHRNVREEYDQGLVVPASHGWDTFPSGGMDLGILDHHAAHVVGHDDCNDDTERCAHDPALCTGDAVRSRQRSTRERRCTSGSRCRWIFADVVRLLFFCNPTAKRTRSIGRHIRDVDGVDKGRFVRSHSDPRGNLPTV
jgi:hypothetical protein